MPVSGDEVDPSLVVVLGFRATGLVAVGAQPTEPIKPQPIEIDTRSYFVTDTTEKERDKLIEWARGEAAKLKFAIIVRRSDNGEKRKPQLVLECERSGKYTSTKKKLKSGETGTRKCGCPFRFRGYYSKETKEWCFTIVNGMHNHELDKALEGHLVVGRLKGKEKEMLTEMKRNLVAPRNILSILKDRDPHNTTSEKQVYNARHRYKVKLRASMTEMQQFFKYLSENRYFFKHRTGVENGVEHLQDIFFAHPRSVSLYISFHTVLMMDSTYNTNRYGMLLFEVVGFTSTEKTFNIGFSWVSNEREDNSIWVLQQLCSLLRSEDFLPKVILTDRDLALMNAVAEVFPTSIVRAPIVVENLSFAFNDFLNSPTVEEYADNVVEFRKKCEKWPKFLRYVEETILDTDKERVVSAWVDRYMHMRNHTTNRAECSHGVLKRYLIDANGDLVSVWKWIYSFPLSFLRVCQEF